MHLLSFRSEQTIYALSDQIPKKRSSQKVVQHYPNQRHVDIHQDWRGQQRKREIDDANPWHDLLNVPDANSNQNYEMEQRHQNGKPPKLG